MFFKQAVQNIFRSKKKSVSLFLILFFVTLVLCLGINVSSSVSAYLEKCRNEYTTIGLFEYMGAEYPDEKVYDPGTARAASELNIEAITSSPYVDEWDSASGALGYIDGFTRFDDLAAFRNRAVLVVRVTQKRTNGLYEGVITACPYSFYDKTNKGLMLNCEVPLTVGHYYLLHGEHRLGNTSYPHVTVIPYQNAGAGIDLQINQLCLDVTDQNGKCVLPAESVLFDIAETYRTVNNSVTVFATSDLDALYPFHQQKLFLTQGRAFSQEEYDNGADVCILSEHAAQKLGVSVGDTVTLSLSLQDGCAIYDSYWHQTGFKSTRVFTIVGLTNTQADMRHYVFIPKNESLGLTDGRFNYTLGTAVIKNDFAEEFYEQFSQNLPDRVRLLVYDQGYAAVTKPFADILRTAVIITAVCAAAGLAVIVLLGYLFVQRQKKASNVMIRLGAGRIHVYGYILWGAGLTAAAAGITGGLVGLLLSGQSAALISRLAENRSVSELLYSNSNLSLSKALTFSSDTKLWMPAVIAGIVIALSVLVCLIFTGSLFLKPKKTKKRSRKSGPKHSSDLSGGAYKYAKLSILRGGFRTAVPILLSVCAVLLMFRLNGISKENKMQLSDIYDKTTVQGTFSDINGTALNGLAVEGYVVNELFRSGYVSDICVTRWYNFAFIGPLTVKGEPVEPNPFAIPPQTSFSYETFFNNMQQGPRLIMTNDLYKTAEFYYSSLVNTEFLNGYDASFLAQETVEGDLPCMLSTDLMAKYGVSLGDKIRIGVFPGRDMYELDMTVVGSYVKDGTKDNIYCPLAAYISPTALFDTAGESVRSNFYRYTFDSVSFTVRNSADLTAFKAWTAQNGYSSVNHVGAVRCFVVLDDRVLLGTTRSLQQRIRYTDTLFTGVFILTELIGFVTAYILVLMRRDELAVMRSLGTPLRRAFHSFFYEQLLLTLPAVLITAGTLIRISGYNILSLLLAAGFAVSWLAGTAVSIIRLNQSKAILLTRKDD